MINKLSSNQKAIRIIKAKADTNNKYAIFNLAALEKAMKNLKPSAFKLWGYLNSNQMNYEFGLSSADAQKVCNFSYNTYAAAVNELIEKGYLVAVELYPNLTGYLFLEDNEMG